ncbi:thiamine-phosphate kinase [Nesterenkonia sp. E16_7]|uniref:thiamine-phosphate kinase n=2 Tax=unclassified Nesterenkonia TaxID=2629769 RepID=UPI001A918E05|nr:thiamine-phosphate kinase [Nesterenkonia sp. E16_7]MBO0598828.1 thiamine-phosphate kinase [Nesterenkonia sp. E16_7]
MTADPAPRSVGESGEDAVLAVILEELGELHRASTDLAALTLAPGDDAAVLELPEDGAPARIVLTTDTLSQDQDFRPGWWAPQQQGAPMGRAVGLKAAAQNLSDLNAMAATPIALLVSLTLPTTTSLDWVRGFYRGLAKAVRREGAEHCHIAGGDLGSGPGISVTLTALGRLPAGRPPLRRTGARPGDQLAVSGPLGAAAAGLALLEAGHPCPGPELSRLRDAQIAPAPRLRTGAQALRRGATAGLDLSDGLLRDAGRLARASSVRVRLDQGALTEQAAALLPAAAALGLPEAQAQAEALRWVTAGGEDYELLASFGAEARLPEGFIKVGEILERTDQAGSDTDGAREVLLTGAIDDTGWDSLQG